MARAAGTDDRAVALPPLAPWDEFLGEFIGAWGDNRSAQHVTIVGPTGQGKTHLALALLAERARVRDSHVVILAVKPKDRTLSALRWPIIRSWPPEYGKRQVIYWPRFGDVRTVASRQRAAMTQVLAEIFADGNRTVYVDEVAYFTDDLRLDDLLRRFWRMGRAQGIVLVAGTQRPRGVPREMFSECSWFFAFRTADQDELRRVSEIGGVDTARLREIMRTLEPHEFVAVQTRTGAMVRSKVSK